MCERGKSMDSLKLKEMRIKSRLSQREVANLLDMAQPHYCRWEQGKMFPNAKQIIKLCDIFKCSPNDLFGFRGIHEIVGQAIDDAE